MNSTKFTTDTDVLIVGSGPVGLMMACQLAIHGINFRIIDKKDRQTNYSGALVIHARTLEILDKIGIADAAIQDGIIAKEITIIINGRRLLKLNISNLGHGLTRFPYILLLEQSRTEQLLVKFIEEYGITIERNKELIDLEQTGSYAISRITCEDGTEEIIRSGYLIGADGGNSSVRRFLKIPVTGETHELPLFITDCYGDVNFGHDEICFSFSNATSTGFFPLPNGKWRIDGIIPNNFREQEELTFEDIEHDFSNRIRLNISITAPEWFSVFYSRHQYAFSFQKGRCFLIGDAAHIFSPVGAQGMNTGLQDAYNLAWKLAFVVEKKTKPEILETYNQERLPVAKQISAASGKALGLVAGEGTIIKMLRIYIVSHFLKFVYPLSKRKYIRKMIFGKLSGVSLHYRKSSLSFGSTISFRRRSPTPGDRLPYVLINEHINIQMLTDNVCFQLFVFTKDSSIANVGSLARKYKDVLTVEILRYQPGSRELFRRFNIKNSGWYLVRPDMYIAACSKSLDLDRFETIFQSILNYEERTWSL